MSPEKTRVANESQTAADEGVVLGIAYGRIPLYDDTFERLAAVTPAGTTPLAARGSHEWLKKPEDVVPLALFMACQHDVRPKAQSFSLMRRF